MVPMLAPDGAAGYIPSDRVVEALQQGGKLGVEMLAPDGTKGIVPRENLVPAIQAGGKVLHDSAQYTTKFEQDRNPDNQPGIIRSAASTVGGLVKGLGSVSAPLSPQAVGDLVQSASKIGADDMARMADGRSGAYRAVAALGSATGVADPVAMEDAADVGNARGVVGTAVGNALPVIAGAALKASPLKRITAKLPTSASISELGDRVFVEGNPKQLMVRAIRPSVVTPELDSAIERRMGEVYQSGQQIGAPVNNLANYEAAVEAAKNAADTRYQHQMSPFRPPVAPINGELLRAEGPYRQVTVDGTPVAERQMRSIPPTEQFERPNQTSFVQRGSRMVEQGDAGIQDKTAVKADRYRRDIPLNEADAIRVDTNAKLRDFWQKAGGDRAAARSNPETARVEAVNNGIRELVYDELHKLTGVDPRPTQEAFGDLSEISDAAKKRGVVYGRQNPVSLAENLGAAEKGIKGFITAKLLKTYSSPDTIVRIAYERWAKERGITPSWKGKQGLTPAGTGGLRPVVISGASRRRD
jgi:hypothetical protein